MVSNVGDAPHLVKDFQGKHELLRKPLCIFKETLGVRQVTIINIETLPELQNIGIFGLNVNSSVYIAYIFRDESS